MGLIVGLIILASTIVLILIALRIWAATLRLAVELTNGVLGGRDLRESDYLRGGTQLFDPVPRPKTLAGVRIPVPGVMYAILVNLAAAFTSGVAQVAAFFAVAVCVAADTPLPADPSTPAGATVQVLSWLVGIPVGMLATVLVLKFALPTTFWRAALVSFFQFLLSLLLAVTIGLAAAAFVIATGGPAAPPGGGWVR
jgi:hypothetical protein